MYWHLHSPCGMLPSNTTSHPHGFAIDGPVTSKFFGGHDYLVSYLAVQRDLMSPHLPLPTDSPVSPHSNLRELQKCQSWTLAFGAGFQSKLRISTTACMKNACFTGSENRPITSNKKQDGPRSVLQKADGHTIQDPPITL